MAYTHAGGYGRRRRARRLEAAILGGALLAVAVILRPVVGDLAGWTAAAPPAATAAPEAAEPGAIVGAATVVDGDGLRIGGATIRLQGLDAFELRQQCDGRACGREARDALESLVFARQVSCRPVDTDRYGRTVAVCHAGGVDLAAEMVRRGHGLAYRRYSTAYVAQEREAQQARAGAWAGDFTDPADWRRANRRG